MAVFVQKYFEKVLIEAFTKIFHLARYMLESTRHAQGMKTRRPSGSGETAKNKGNKSK